MVSPGPLRSSKLAGGPNLRLVGSDLDQMILSAAPADLEGPPFVLKGLSLKLAENSDRGHGRSTLLRDRRLSVALLL